MRNYQTFQEAKIENPELKIYYSMIARCGKDAVFGTYDSLIRFTDSFHECKPADYLPSLEWFFNEGHSLACGDLILDRSGNVIEIGKLYTPMDNDGYYVLRASCLTETKAITESPEEKEALDMIDATSKQVDSLASSSELPNGSEWKNGDSLLWKNGNGELLECNTGRYIGYDSVENKHIFVRTDVDTYYIMYAKHSAISKPESPEQKAERERLEAAFEVYLAFWSASKSTIITMNMSEFKECSDLSYWLAVVDKTGYRKAAHLKEGE